MSGAHYAVTRSPCTVGCGRRGKTFRDGELVCWDCWEWAETYTTRKVRRFMQPMPWTVTHVRAFMAMDGGMPERIA